MTAEMAQAVKIIPAAADSINIGLLFLCVLFLYRILPSLKVIFQNCYIVMPDFIIFLCSFLNLTLVVFPCQVFSHPFHNMDALILSV